ncbi:hypothetical protein C0993_001514 [Termitomyces sp. T159_Od127]|nr:hypothetical protein C0993_001514 [Termitomyces sp. T159_Od127]
MTTAARRKTPNRMMTKSSRSIGVSVDNLAEHLTSNLVISNAKGKQKATTLSEEQLRLEAMRAVNSASQQLSAAIQSGWKRSSCRNSTRVVTAVTTATKHLATLRQNGPGNVDIERVAMTVLGKLVSLELYDEAFSTLEALHSRLCELLEVTRPSPFSRHHLVLMPFPNSENIDPTLLILTLTYLAYSLTVLTNLSLSSARNLKEASISLDALSNVLDNRKTCFLAWVPRNVSTPSNQLDSLLTRAYTALTKACVDSHTSSGTVESTTFWNQIVKFGSAFVKSQEVKKEEAMRAVPAAFMDLVRIVEKRDGAFDFMSGKGFVGFCEYWLAIAKRAGDLCLVDRIAGLIRGISLDSTQSSNSKQDTPISVESGKQVPHKVDVEHDNLAAARLCAIFTQAISAIEQKSPDMVARVREVFATLKGSSVLPRLLKATNNDSDDYVRVSEKLDRALERLRRAVISASDSSASQPILENPLYLLLEEIFEILKQLTFPDSNVDKLTRTLDTLFVLTRLRLIPSDPRTYIPAYDLLSQATSILEPHATDPNVDTPNYLRCISGAFHNLAGALYQAGRYGSAVSFLKDACSLGIRALETRRKSALSDEGRAAEGWKQLEEQLYRRWDLLGVCYLKNGDYQVRPAILLYVCELKHNLASLTKQAGLATIFSLSTGTKQLATVVDRVSNLTACELLMKPSAVSLSSLSIGDDGVIGALLERQIESLEAIRYKENVSKVISYLLSDILKIYGSDMPVRRARVLVKWLEHMYYSGRDMVSGVGNPDDIGNEVEDLLQSENLDKDTELAAYVSQYRAATYLWRALHAHRRMDNRQNDLVAHYSDEACRILRTLLGTADLAIANRPLLKQNNPLKKITPGPLAKPHSPRKISSAREPSKKISREPITPKSKSQKAGVYDLEDRGISVNQRIRSRVKRVEMAAIASQVFSLIQYSMGDVSATVDGMLQALRLWNKAADSLMRLSPVHSPSQALKNDDPFEISSLKDALSKMSTEDTVKELSPQKTFPQRNPMDGLEWRISEGLIATLLSLSEIYLSRGSAREAQYFAQQAHDLAKSLNAPTSASRALAKKGEIQLYQGLLDASMECLTGAAALVHNQHGVESIDIQRLRGAYSERVSHTIDAGALYDETLAMIEEFDQVFQRTDSFVFNTSRKSIGTSPVSKTKNEALLPELFAAVLRHRIWLLRDSNVQDYSKLLGKFLLLPHSSRTKSEENVLMAKLTLHAVYGRFRADMFLSSLTESTIALPMGMTSELTNTPSSAAQDILVSLEAAEKFFWACLVHIARTGKITDVRDGIVSLALVQAFQTSLGKSNVNAPNLTVGLLGKPLAFHAGLSHYFSIIDASAAITLRREMLQTIRHKFPPETMDDIKWPIFAADGSPRPQLRATRGNTCFASNSPLQSEDEGMADPDETSLREYWDSVRLRYQAQILDPLALSSSQVVELPSNWTVVHINVNEDKSTLFIARQECGCSRAPLIFCVPLKGRRDNGNSDEDEEQHLTFEDAIKELEEIVKLSDEGTKSAIHIKNEDQEARAMWWKQRAALDIRLRDLLKNVEFCWLGGFKAKTILNPRSNLSQELIADLRAQFEKVFHRGLLNQDKKAKPRRAQRKGVSQTENPVKSQITFSDALLERFSTLSPKCRDEELEDLVYFILDLYQSYGVPVAIAEVDVFQVILDLRVVLEDHLQRLARENIQKLDDEHLFLVLDKNLQGLPWESIPVLRGRSVSRVPSVDFLHDRVIFAERKREAIPTGRSLASTGAVVDPRRGYYILNPSGDLHKTEARFRGWAADMEKAGWNGIIGRAPSEQQFLNALRNQDIVV